MPKTKISEFDVDPANNTDINSINIAEGCAPSGINNAIRQLMADLKEFQTGAGGDPFNGAVNGTVGATTPAAGTFTTVTANTSMSTDTISEKTSAAGVTVDGVLLKDNAVSASGGFTQNSTFNSASTMGFKNRIINGAMMIDQRNAGASVNNTAAGLGTYTLDRWLAYGTAATKFSIQQNAGAVTPPAGFTNYLGVTSSAATTVASTDLYYITQRLEGFNVADLGWGTANASPVTLSFWVRSSLTGSFGGALLNSAGTRSYPFTYTISSANTWTQISITVAGETTGAWLTNNGIGIAVTFGLGVGSTYSTTAGAWATGTFISATGATSVVGTNGATFYITGVQLEKGSTATSFDYRPYGTELALCQRYFEKSFPIATAPANNIITSTFNVTQFLTSAYASLNGISQNFSFQVSKRAAPTMTFYNVYALGSANGTNGQWKWYNAAATTWRSTSTVNSNQITNEGFIAAIDYDATVTIGYSYFSGGEWTASAEL